MPHPNPPAKQNLDKKGLLTISSSAYCNIYLVYDYILTALNSPLATNNSLTVQFYGWGEGYGRYPPSPEEYVDASDQMEVGGGGWVRREGLFVSFLSCLPLVL